jgi:hypothetical protein
MKKTDLAWAAGFLDGEGHFYCTKTYVVPRKRGKGKRVKAYPYFKIAAVQSNRIVLDRLQRIIGGSISGPYDYPPSEPYFSFCLCTNALKIFKKLYPYLSTVKRFQGEAAEEKLKEQNKLRKLRIK